MLTFKLRRDKQIYTIYKDDIDLTFDRFDSELAAILWANAFISSWDCATLETDFERKPSMEQFYG